MEIKGIGLTEDFLAKFSTEKAENIEEFSQILIALFSNLNSTVALSQENVLDGVGLSEVSEEANKLLLETSTNQVFNQEICNYLYKANINPKAVTDGKLFEMNLSDIESFIEESKKMLSANETLTVEKMNSLQQEIIKQLNTDDFITKFSSQKFENVKDFSQTLLALFSNLNNPTAERQDNLNEVGFSDISEEIYSLLDKISTKVFNLEESNYLHKGTIDLKVISEESDVEDSTTEVKLPILKNLTQEETQYKDNVINISKVNKFNEGHLLTEENFAEIENPINQEFKEQKVTVQGLDKSLKVEVKEDKEAIKPNLNKMGNNSHQQINYTKINTELDNSFNLKSFNNDETTTLNGARIEAQLDSKSEDITIINHNSAILNSSEPQSISSENTKLNNEVISRILDNQDIYEIITEKFKALKLPEINELRVKLKPKELGDLVVRVTLEKGQINGSITADKKEVAAILSSHVDNIKQELKNNNVNLTNLSINVNSEENQNSHQGRNFQQKNKQNKEKFIDIINEKMDEDNKKEFSIIV